MKINWQFRLGDFLQDYRMEFGINGYDLAKKLNLSSATYYRIESLEHNYPPIYQVFCLLKTIAKLRSMSVSELACLMEGKKPGHNLIVREEKIIEQYRKLSAKNRKVTKDFLNKLILEQEEVNI